MAIEYDGLWHDNPAQFDADRRRLNRVVVGDWIVLHLTAKRLREDFDGFVAEVRAALRSRSHGHGHGRGPSAARGDGGQQFGLAAVQGVSGQVGAEQRHADAVEDTQGQAQPEPGVAEQRGGDHRG